MSFDISNTSEPGIMMSLLREVNFSSNGNVASNFWISDWMECLLRTVALNNFPPTVCARWCFILSAIIYNAYAYVSNKTPVDFQNPSNVNYWPSKSNSNVTSHLPVWMEYVCQYAVPILLQTWLPYSIAPHASPNSAFVQLDPSDPSSIQSLIAAHKPLAAMDQTSQACLSNFRQLVQTYFSARHNDGWLNSFTFNQSYNNNANLYSFIDGNNTSSPQDLNNLPNPDKWTPVKVTLPGGQSFTKSYVTPEWGTANSGILDDSSRAAIQADAQQLFPDPVSQPARWRQEIQNGIDAQANVGDEEKIISEYWLQCPGATLNSVGTFLYGTPSPSGVWIAFADIYLRSNNKTIEDEIRYYFMISSGIFEASLNAWKLKRANLQARPIQKIRQALYNPSQSVNTPIHQDWNPATPVINGVAQNNSGAYWLPYQTLDTVSPPFPDFVSGHSTFGAAAAKLMCYLTGTDQVVLQNPVTNLLIFKYTSQLFYNNSGWKNASINNIFIYPGCSAVQPSPGFNGALHVPLSGIRLNWPTWSQMANSNGESRIYGGVHWESSNQGGLLVGNAIADELWTLYRNL
jgi:membrane-associated phospholipid phosphatase